MLLKVPHHLCIVNSGLVEFTFKRYDNSYLWLFLEDLVGTEAAFELLLAVAAQLGLDLYELGPGLRVPAARPRPRPGHGAGHRGARLVLVLGHALDNRETYIFWVNKTLG